MLDARSTVVLAQICPDLAAKVQAASDALNAENTFILVVSGLRTADQQNALYAQGRPDGGHIVTNARAGYSMHNYGLAVDVVPYLTGPTGQVNWTYSTPQFQRLVGAMKAQGLEWGGDWKGSLGDYDHFQLTDLPSSPSAIMRTDYGTGITSLDPIWAKATDGSYAV